MISRVVQCEGLVLRNLRFGDTSRVATLLTRELGKVGVIAKGARDPRSAFGASLEILSHSSFVLYYRPGRELQFLKSGSLEAEFRGILAHPARYRWGTALAEFLDRMLPGEEPAAELFDLALRGFAVIDTEFEERLPELFRALQLRLAARLGYAPRLESCLHCRREPGDRREDVAWVVSLPEGGILCPDCAGSEAMRPDHLPVSPAGLRRLQRMVHGRRPAPAGMPPSPSSDVAGVDGSRGTGDTGSDRVAEPRPPNTAWIRTLDHLTESFLRYHLPGYRGLRCLEARGWEEIRDRPSESS